MSAEEQGCLFTFLPVLFPSHLLPPSSHTKSPTGLWTLASSPSVHSSAFSTYHRVLFCRHSFCHSACFSSSFSFSLGEAWSHLFLCPSQCLVHYECSVNIDCAVFLTSWEWAFPEEWGAGGGMLSKTRRQPGYRKSLWPSFRQHCCSPSLGVLWRRELSLGNRLIIQNCGVRGRAPGC